MKKLFIALILSFGLALFSQTYVSAQTAPNGVSVSPSIAYIDLAKDPPQYSLTYTNNTNSDITLDLSVKDFSELENGYRIDFLQGQSASNYKYGLSSWISFENNQLELSPHESQSVTVFIDKNRITKGGHYASILAEIAQPDIKQQVGVKAVLSSLLFVRAATGQEIEEGSIYAFGQDQNGLGYPTSYFLRFQNSGNVYVIPYGYIEVYGPLGNLVGKGIVNENSLVALPESIRDYDINIKNYQNFLLPGTYTAKLYVHFGKTDKKLYSSVKFLSQGSFDFGEMAILIILFAALIVIYRKKFVKHATNSS